MAENKRSVFAPSLDAQLKEQRDESVLSVEHVTKKFGEKVAVSDVSFQIKKGSIVGFLGPNGAGKSTTMNVICGYYGATEGKVYICGKNIVEEPVKAKHHLGYLPEQPPVYPTMTVWEYLIFVYELKGIKGDKKAEVMSVMEKTKLTNVKDRVIRNLSKGYRQRVGIAQALLGSPELLILDEPTVGLDPMQVVEFREVIREYAKDHAVILSTHILSEVSALCDRVLIIRGGKLIADASAEELASMENRKAARLTLSDAEEMLSLNTAEQLLRWFAVSRYRMAHPNETEKKAVEALHALVSDEQRVKKAEAKERLPEKLIDALAMLMDAFACVSRAEVKGDAVELVLNENHTSGFYSLLSSVPVPVKGLQMTELSLEDLFVELIAGTKEKNTDMEDRMIKTILCLGEFHPENIA